MSDQFGNETPQGGPGMPPPGSPDPHGGVTPPPAPAGMPTGAPTAAGYNPAAAASQWSPQGYGSGNLGDQPPVGVGGRLGARLIDMIIIIAIGFLPVVLAMSVAVALVFNVADPSVIQNDPEAASKALAPALTLASLMVFVPIYIINDVVMVKLKGWNLGKLVLQQRVVDATSGEFLTWGQAFKRFLLYYGPTILISIISIFVSELVSSLLSLASGFWYIALLVSIAMGGALFQGWHDKFAGSKVVKKPAF